MTRIVHRITAGERFDDVRALARSRKPDLARAALARRVGLSQCQRVFDALADLHRVTRQESAAHMEIRAEWESRLLNYIGHAYPHAIDAAREAIE